MANAEHLKILNQGVEGWNQWRKENPDVTPDLTGATLTGATLAGATLAGADLADANLAGAYLRGADVVGAEAAGADLRETRITEADEVSPDAIDVRIVFSADVREWGDLPTPEELAVKLAELGEALSLLNIAEGGDGLEVEDELFVEADDYVVP